MRGDIEGNGFVHIVEHIFTQRGRVDCFASYGCQTGARLESLCSNACDAAGDGYRGQTTAIYESTFSNACDAVGNGYGGQTAATIESPVSNACNAVFDDDGFNGSARGIPRGISRTVTTIICIIRCILKNSYNFVIELSHRGME